MKKYSAIIPIIIFILITFYFFVLPRMKSSNYSLNAIVISISPESKRSGKSEIQLKDESKAIDNEYLIILNEKHGIHPNSTDHDVKVKLEELLGNDYKKHGIIINHI